MIHTEHSDRLRSIVIVLAMASIVPDLAMAQASRASEPAAGTGATQSWTPATGRAAATGTKPERPIVGLALSGGGARGIAHIGVLEWLEEQRVPVDRVAGTSMGGLVGSLYAMGMTPAEIRELVRDIDWDQMFRLRPAHQQLSFRRKEDQREFPNQLEFGLNRGGLKPPSGLNAGHHIGLLFDRITLGYHDIADFDQLPIPFRCVGADMETAEAVVLGEGSLSLALRTTMSVPAVFTPVELDGRILADGGILDNIPVDVVKDMGADIVIAVNIGTPLGDRDSIQTLFGMLGQTLGVTTVESNRMSMRLADHAIQPDLLDTTNTDFRDAQKIADLGYAAVTRTTFDWHELALPEDDYRAFKASVRARRRAPPPAPGELVVSPPDRLVEDKLRRRLAPQLGTVLDPAALEEALTAVVGKGRHNRLGYQIRDSEVQVQADLKTNGPGFLRLGLEMSNARPDNVDLTFKSRLTVLGIGGHGAEWRNDVNLGSFNRVFSEYYRPLGNGPVFVAPYGFYENGIVDVYQSDRRLAEYVVRRFGAGVNLGASLKSSSEIRFGYQERQVDAKVTVGDTLLPTIDGRESILSLRFRLDHQNSPVVPTSGGRFNLEAEWVFDAPGAADDFPRISALGSLSRPLGERSSVFVGGRVGANLTSEGAPATQDFTLGGPLRLSAYRPDEFRGNHFALGSIGYLNRVLDLPLILGKGVHAAAFVEVGSAFDGNIHDARFRGSLSGGLLAETTFGAAFFGGGISGDGASNWFVSLGRLF